MRERVREITFNADYFGPGGRFRKSFPCQFVNTSPDEPIRSRSDPGELPSVVTLQGLDCLAFKKLDWTPMSVSYDRLSDGVRVTQTIERVESIEEAAVRLRLR